MVIAAGGEEERARIAPHSLVESQRTVVERLGSRQIAHVKVHVAHGRTFGGAVPFVAFARRDQTADVERLGGHHELVAPVRPGGTGPICIDLDPKTVGVAQVQRFADRVVGHARSEPQTEHVCCEAPERHSVGQEKSEVEQAESATRWHRRNTVLLDEVRQRPRCTSYAERSSTCSAFEHVHAEHALVVLDRALQIADLQVNRADVSLLGQTLRRLNTVRTSGCLSLAHSSLHPWLSIACQDRAASTVERDLQSSPTGIRQLPQNNVHSFTTG